MPELANLLLQFFVLTVSLSVHEASHAWVAFRLGDDTAARMGRLSLNPLVHMDPLGSLMMLSGMFIGWAKPVPVDARNIRNPRSGLPLVSFAGPLSNILLGILFCLVFAIVSPTLSPGSGWYLLIVFFIKTNFALAIFNLLPIWPLDGSKIITVFMSDRVADQYEERMMRLGMFPLIILVAFEFLPFGKGVLGLWFQLWSPLVRPILMVFGIPPWLLGY